MVCGAFYHHGATEKHRECTKTSQLRTLAIGPHVDRARHEVLCSLLPAILFINHKVGPSMLLRISLVIVSLLSVCCHNNTPSATVWSTDKEPVMRRLPFLNQIEACWWVSGVATDNSKGAVPGPSSSFVRGYIKVNQAELSRLISSYKWTSLQNDEFQRVEPPKQYTVPPMSGRLMKSEQLMQSLVAITTFRNGIVVLAPDNNVMYFDLAED